MIQIDLEIPKCCDECKFVYDSCKCIITGSSIDWDKSDSERLLDCPLNKIAEPYKGMTNGEVLEAVFPNIVFGRKVFDDSMWVDMEDIAAFKLDWWDSPYEPQENCDTCKHKDDGWDSEHCDGCCGNHSGFEPQESEG